MTNDNGFKRDFSSPTSRWASFGPYYAMFPLELAYRVVAEFSEPGQFVLDPFAGRATSVYAAAVQSRQSVGIEITSVGWLFGQAKLSPAPLQDVLARLDHVRDVVSEYSLLVKDMPEFYRYCFSPNVLAFLLAARATLLWKTVSVDTTLMAFIVMYLHGKLGEGLSNQMRMTKAMSPEYSIKWWKENNYSTPPDVKWYEFLRKRIHWRYEKGIPPAASGQLLLGDSTVLLEDVTNAVLSGKRPYCSLLFTSPPYCGVINYYKDQWIRNWMLGAAELPKASINKYEKRFVSQGDYVELLTTVFGDIACIMADKAVVYVRTDARDFTRKTTVRVLQEKFPGWDMETVPVPVKGQTQTCLFGDKTEKPGEMDVILCRR
jgi:hypothetical protein